MIEILLAILFIMILLLAANVKTRPSQITIFYINSHAKSKAETVRHIL